MRIGGLLFSLLVKVYFQSTWGWLVLRKLTFLSFPTVSMVFFWVFFFFTPSLPLSGSSSTLFVPDVQPQ